MAYKDDKVIEILMEQAGAIPERCEGYSDEIKEAVADIIAKERQNKYSRTNIKVQVSDVVTTVGAFLHTRSAAGRD